MSDLRRSAGESPIPLNTVEKIEQMVRLGELPKGDICPVSSRLADCTIIFHVQCESSYLRGSRDGSEPGATLAWMMLLGMIFGMIIGVLGSRGAKRQEELGRNIEVELPLRVASSAAESILQLKNQSKLKALLRQTEIYAKLLDEYPKAFVTAKSWR